MKFEQPDNPSTLVVDHDPRYPEHDGPYPVDITMNLNMIGGAASARIQLTPDQVADLHATLDNLCEDWYEPGPSFAHLELGTRFSWEFDDRTFVKLSDRVYAELGTARTWNDGDIRAKERVEEL